jgi:biopolymer transport protein ExbD
MAMAPPEGEGDSVAEINVTPMVDVLLCLLIIFMVTSPKPPNEQIPMNVPRDTVVQQPNDPHAALLVSIDAQGNAKLGQQPLSKDYDEMIEQFRKNEKAQSDGRVVIKGEDKTKYGMIIRVMAAAHESGIEQVSVSSDKL